MRPLVLAFLVTFWALVLAVVVDLWVVVFTDVDLHGGTALGNWFTIIALAGFVTALWVGRRKGDES